MTDPTRIPPLLGHEVHALDPFGVEVAGFDLARELGDAELAELRAFLVEHELVLFRDQQLPAERQAALGRRLGPVEGQEYTAGSPHPDVIVISNLDAEGRVAPRTSAQMKGIAINEQWHTDSSFREHPATFSIFHAITVPPEGGDTYYASLRRGYERLAAEAPETLARLDGLCAVHDYTRAYRNTGFGEMADQFGLVPRHHPLVRTHPESGRRCLFVTRHAWAVDGLPEDEARALLDELVACVTRDDAVYRQRWRPGDVLVWDNRSVLHRAQGFDERHARVMHHVRVAGTAAVR